MMTKILYVVAVVAVLASSGLLPATSGRCFGRDTADSCDNSPPPPRRPVAVAAVRG